MARRIAQSDPALDISFFLSGFYTHRSQLFAPFKGIGINVISFHDPVIDGKNMEDTDLYEWQRRPGFSIYCTTPLADTEIINQFYSSRNLDGDVTSYFDSTQRLATFTTTDITTLITKTTTEQGYANTVGNMTYFSDGAAADMQIWDSTTPLSAINPFPWGIPAPTLTPSISNHGLWLPFIVVTVNNAILDPNGSVEVVTAVFGAAGVTGANEPLWPTTLASTINDGSVQWTNMGPLDSWLPETNYPVPVVVLDTNGNLQLATTANNTVEDWDSGTEYGPGTTVFFGGNYWTALVTNTDVPPSPNYTVTTGGTTQPYWVLSQNPITTGAVAPVWNQTVGDTTDNDGSYTWTNLGPGQLTESFGTSYVYCYRTIYGHLSTASPASINTGSIFGPTIATITSFAITDNIVTFQGANNFIPGNVFSVQGLTNGIYLNNQPFIVLAAGLSPTQFSAVFDSVNIASTVDSGSTLNLVATVTGTGNTSVLCNAAASITASQVVAGVVTLYSVSNYVPGLQVTFTGLTVATFLNNLQFEIINVDPNGTWFQVYYTNALGVVPPDQPITTDTGTATFNSIEIYRVSDGGGIYLFTGAVSNPTGSTILPYDSGINTAGLGVDTGVPGTFVWANPNNVTSPSAYATVTVPTPQPAVVFDKETTATGATTAISVGPLTPVQANEFALLAATTVEATGRQTITAGAGFSAFGTTLNNASSGNCLYSESGVSGAVTGTATIGSTTAGWCGALILFGAVGSPAIVTEAVVFNGGVTNGSHSFGPQTPVAGNSIIIVTENSQTSNTGNGIASISDTQGNTYTKIADISNTTGTGSRVQVYFAPQVAGGSNTITLVTSGNSGFNTFETSYFEVSGLTELTPSGGARFNVVQSCQSIIAAMGNPPSIQANFPSNVTAANEILLYVTTYAVPAWAVSDSQGNHYSQIAQEAYTNPNGDIVTNTVYLATGVSAGATTVKVSIIGRTPDTAFFGLIASECSGLIGTAETPVAHTQVTGTTLNPGSITTGTANEVIFSFLWSDLGSNSSNVATLPPGYTQSLSQVAFDATGDNFGNTYQQMIAAYQVQSSIVTASPTWSTPGNKKGIGITVSLPLSSYQPSDGLNATKFGFAVPPSITITGIEIDFDALFTGTSSFGILDVQLLKNGTPVGLIMQVQPTSTVNTYVLGGTGNLWNTIWASSDFNTAAWGVQITATQLVGGTNATFSVRNVRARLTGSTSTTGWVFNDFTTDANLDALQIAPQNHANDPPPGAPGSSVNQNVGTITAFWQNRFWMVAGNYVYFDAGPDCTNGIPEQSWPPGNRFQFAGMPFALVPSDDGVALLVYLADRVNVIMGGPETISFYASDALSNFGISNPNAIFRDGSIIGQFTTQKQYFELIEKNKQETGEHIADYLTANFSAASAYVTMHRNGEDVGTFLSNGVDQILRYGNNIGAWSVPAFPVGGAGALRSIETSIGQYNLMLASPTGGTTGSTSLTNPQSGATTGATGTAWENPSNITVGDPSTYATVSLSATPSFDIIQTINQNDTNTDSQVVNLSSVSVGDAILFVVNCGDTFQISGVTDNLGNTYSTLIFGQSNLVIGSITTAGTNVEITVSLNGSPDNCVSIGFQASGLSTNGSDNDAVGSQGASSGVINADGGAATSFANELIFGGAGTANWTGTLTVDDGATLIAEQNGTIASYYTVSETGTYDVQYNKPVAVISTVSVLTWPISGGATVFSQILAASGYILNIPEDAIVQGVQVSVTGKTTNTAASMSITPLNAVSGAESDTFTLTESNTTQTFGGPADLWGMNAWLAPTAINSANFGFGIVVSLSSGSAAVSISEVQVTVFYQAPGNYIRYRDLTAWADNGITGQNNGTFYDDCYVTVGSITLSALGAEMFDLQHVVGYFDAVGTLNNGAPSQPNIWILPNEVNDTAGIGFVQLPEVLQEPPIGQNHPSASLLALRWPVNMMNSYQASQFIHHLQVKVDFSPESAPNTLKALAFKEQQD